MLFIESATLTWERDEEIIPDVETSDDDCAVENGTDNEGDIPSFRIVLNASHFRRTLVSTFVHSK